MTGYYDFKAKNVIMSMEHDISRFIKENYPESKIYVVNSFSPCFYTAIQLLIEAFPDFEERIVVVKPLSMKYEKNNLTEKFCKELGLTVHTLIDTEFDIPISNIIKNMNPFMSETYKNCLELAWAYNYTRLMLIPLMAENNGIQLDILNAIEYYTLFQYNECINRFKINDLELSLFHRLNYPEVIEIGKTLGIPNEFLSDNRFQKQIDKIGVAITLIRDKQDNFDNTDVCYKKSMPKFEYVPFTKDILSFKED